MEKIINLKGMSQKSKVALIGGIMINLDGDGSDRFLPMHFELRTLTDSEDLFEATFGRKSTK